MQTIIKKVNTLAFLLRTIYTKQRNLYIVVYFEKRLAKV